MTKYDHNSTRHAAQRPVNGGISAVPRHPSPRRRSLRQRWHDGLQVLRHRWSNTMPKFFRIVCWLSALIGGTALAVNTAITSGGGTTHEWWNDIYPYLIGIPAGAAFVAKFTQNYDRNGNPVRKSRQHEGNRIVLNQDIDHMNATQPGIPLSDRTDGDGKSRPCEIDPYNEG